MNSLLTLFRPSFPFISINLTITLTQPNPASFSCFVITPSSSPPPSSCLSIPASINEHKFVLCPFGHGLDTHRVSEVHTLAYNPPCPSLYPRHTHPYTLIIPILITSHTHSIYVTSSYTLSYTYPSRPQTCLIPTLPVHMTHLHMLCSPPY